MEAQSQARSTEVLEHEPADLLEEQGDKLNAGCRADDIPSRVAVVRAWLQGMEQEAAQLKLNIAFCQEIISKYDELERSRSASCAGTSTRSGLGSRIVGSAVVSVEPVSIADEADSSTDDHTALQYTQRFDAILRAPRLPDVINLANVQNPEKGDYDEEIRDDDAAGRRFKELSGGRQERLVDWHVTQDNVALTTQQRAQLLNQLNAQTNVTILNLSANARDSRELLEAIKNQRNLKTLDLSWNYYSVYTGYHGREEKFVLFYLR